MIAKKNMAEGFAFDSFLNWCMHSLESRDLAAKARAELDLVARKAKTERLSQAVQELQTLSLDQNAERIAVVRERVNEALDELSKVDLGFPTKEHFHAWCGNPDQQELVEQCKLAVVGSAGRLVFNKLQELRKRAALLEKSLSKNEVNLPSLLQLYQQISEKQHEYIASAAEWRAVQPPPPPPQTPTLSPYREEGVLKKFGPGIGPECADCVTAEGVAQFCHYPGNKKPKMPICDFRDTPVPYDHTAGRFVELCTCVKEECKSHTRDGRGPAAQCKLCGSEWVATCKYCGEWVGTAGLNRHVRKTCKIMGGDTQALVQDKLRNVKRSRDSTSASSSE
jgi:hypothetical protein